MPKATQRILMAALLWTASPALALPPPNDTPEEVLRGQPSLAARSPIDNQPLTPDEYERLKLALRQLEVEPAVQVPEDPRLSDLVHLLRLRQFIRSFIPLF